MTTPTRHWTGFDLPGRALGQAEARGYARACWPQASATELEFLAVQIAVMTALDDAFDRTAVRVHPRALLNLVPWRARSSPPKEHLGRSEWAHLQDALAHLDRAVLELAPGDAPRRVAARQWWRRRAEQQAGAFFREAQWRVQGVIPDLDTYLRVAQRSIGVEWMAASLVALDAEADVPRPRTPLARTIDAIARATRLANDLHDPERELQEGKVQWLLLRAWELEGSGEDAHAAECHARAELQLAVLGEVARARSILRSPVAHGVGSDRLREALEGLLGVGLAVYAPHLAAA